MGADFPDEAAPEARVHLLLGLDTLEPRLRVEAASTQERPPARRSTIWPGLGVKRRSGYPASGSEGNRRSMCLGVYHNAPPILLESQRAEEGVTRNHNDADIVDSRQRFDLERTGVSRFTGCQSQVLLESSWVVTRMLVPELFKSWSMAIKLRQVLLKMLPGTRHGL